MNLIFKRFFKSGASWISDFKNGSWGRRFAICWLVLLFPMAINAIDSAVILQYHFVGTETPDSTSISPTVFEQHLDYLEKQGVAVWPLERIVTALKEKMDLPDRCVAITFDDAYDSVYTEAYPRLRKRGWPFTVFVATEAVDNSFQSVMSWQQMSSMDRQLVTFSSHSHTHPYMVQREKGESEQQWKARMMTEIRVSRDKLTQNGLGRSFLFAYPYGEYDLTLRNLVEEEDLVGFGQHSGAIWSGSDFLALPRFPLSGTYGDINEFKVKVNALAMPVVSMSPMNPVITAEDNPPTLKISLAKAPLEKHTLTCYASGQGRMPLRWISNTDDEFETAAPGNLPVGRSRYNCTARHSHENRYFWFSHQWVRLK